MNVVDVLGHQSDDSRVKALRQVMSHALDHNEAGALNLLRRVYTVLWWNKRVFGAVNNERGLVDSLNF